MLLVVVWLQAASTPLSCPLAVRLRSKLWQRHNEAARSAGRVDGATRAELERVSHAPQAATDIPAAVLMA
jgi:hypothetical protein